MSEFDPKPGDDVVVRVAYVWGDGKVAIGKDVPHNGFAYVHKSTVRPLPPAMTPTEARIVEAGYALTDYIDRINPQRSGWSAPALAIAAAVDADRAASAEAAQVSPEPVAQAEPVALDALEREALEAALIHWNTPHGTPASGKALTKWHDAAEKVMACRRAPVNPVAKLREGWTIAREYVDAHNTALRQSIDAAIAALEARK